MKARKILLFLLAVSPLLLTDCSEIWGARPFFDDLAALLATDTGGEAWPDVVYMDGLEAQDYINRGWLYPVDGVVALDEFDPRLKPYFQRGGDTYAVPHDVQTVALVANLALLEQAGISEDLLYDMDLEQFRAIGAAISESGDEVYGLGLTPGLWNFMPFLFAYGGSLLDQEQTGVTLDTPEAAAALDYYTGLYQEEWVFPPGGMWLGEWPTWGMYDTMLDAFADNKIGMLLVGPSMYDDLLERMDLDPSASGPVKLYELPVGPAGRATVGYVRGLALLDKPGQGPSEAAMRFLEFATNEENMKLWIGEPGTPSDFVPARPALLAEWQEVHPNREAFMVGVEYMQPKQSLRAPFAAMSWLDEEATVEITAALLGEITVEEALAVLQAKSDEILQQE